MAERQPEQQGGQDKIEGVIDSVDTDSDYATLTYVVETGTEKVVSADVAAAVDSL